MMQNAFTPNPSSIARPSLERHGLEGLASGAFSRSSNPASHSQSHNRIPRPRNAFMIFRSEFCAGKKILRSVERDHRHISRIVGYCWNKLSESEKDIWRDKAEQEKMDHSRKYPGYHFTPTVRSKKPVKRNVKRNGVDDLLRCQRLADLLISGKEGNELEDAAKDLGTNFENPLVGDARDDTYYHHTRLSRDAKISTNQLDSGTVGVSERIACDQESAMLPESVYYTSHGPYSLAMPAFTYGIVSQPELEAYRCLDVSVPTHKNSSDTLRYLGCLDQRMTLGQSTTILPGWQDAGLKVSQYNLTPTRQVTSVFDSPLVDSFPLADVLYLH
ncbi:hypothetical protein AX17_000350 [Amanita inopinata Kibby_2008]|nr:hypothetical protein AX17_000350 [Amanita inopinata Kibby_2008]